MLMHSIITGGSSGLGFEIAKALVNKGLPVVILGRNGKRLQDAHRALQSLGGQDLVMSYALELTQPNDIDNFCEFLSQHSIANINLFNVAGSGYFGKIEDITLDDINRVLSANLTGLMLFSAKMAAFMKQHTQGRARIISILSTAALKGKRYETIYNAAKWGARGFLESLREELTDTAIEVINVFPGGMKTPFWKDSQSDYAIESFMDAAHVAHHIVHIALDPNVLVTDITLGRPK